MYCLGSLAENEDVKARLVEMGAIPPIVRQLNIGNVEIKRAAGYFFATMCEQVEYHPDLATEGALEAIVSLAKMEDIECQEYAAFSLAHIASNREYQVRLVELGAVRPIVAMLACDAEPKHYAGLALLKLADNFENHLKIAEEGGIQALLRLGRTRSTDEQLQHKAALTVGQLASNAVKLMEIPSKDPILGGEMGKDRNIIGHGTRMMSKLRSQVSTEKARTLILQQLEDQPKKLEIEDLKKL